MSYKPTIKIDFDGVLHTYTSGWKGILEAPDSPVKGAKEAMHSLQEGYQVEILSTRASCGDGKATIKAYLEKHGFPPLKPSNRKDKAILYVDDRAIPFRYNWEITEKAVRTFEVQKKSFGELGSESLPTMKAVMNRIYIAFAEIDSLFEHLDEDTDFDYLRESLSTPGRERTYLNILEDIFEIRQNLLDTIHLVEHHASEREEE